MGDTAQLGLAELQLVVMTDCVPALVKVCFRVWIIRNHCDHCGRYTVGPHTRMS